MHIKFLSTFSLKKIVGISLILSANYYFYMRKFLFFNLEKVTIQTLILFFFTLFLLYLILKFFDIMQDKLKRRKLLKSLIIYFFFAWLLVQSLKAIFLVSNYITLPEFIFKIFLLEKFNEYESITRIIKYFIPYIFSFIFIFFIRNKLVKFSNFFVILGYILFVLICYDLSLKIFSHKLFESPKAFLNGDNYKEKIQKNRKVIWVVFDEFDPEIAFSNTNSDKFMPNFIEFKKSSFTHQKMYPPAMETLMSMPAQLIGTKIVGTEIKNNTFTILVDDTTSVTFSYENTIFNRLEKKGFNSSILSSVLPYCSMLLKVKKCKEPNEEWYKGIVFVFPVVSKIKLFFKLVNLNNDKILDVKLLQNINANQYIDKIYDIDGYNTINFALFEKFINSSSNLIFVHVFIPHLPANLGFGEQSNYAEKLFNIKVNKGLPSYMLNLKLTDIVLKKMLYIVDKINIEDKMLILSSDHWYRLRDRNNPHPALFIAKIYGDDNEIETSKPATAIYIQELIYKFLLKEISTHSDIKKFFEKKTFIKTYVP